MEIRVIEWDGHNAWKPLRHGVTLSEVEEVFYNAPSIRRVAERYIALGQTDAGRYLTVIFIIKPRGVIRPITARPMDSKERRQYERR